MTKYAEDTVVSPEKSMMEIQQVLKRYGANKFALLDEGNKLTVGFEMRKRAVRFTITLPTQSDVLLDPAGRKRNPAKIPAALEKETRQRYRALLLVIKAKLESVESGIETFEQAFLAHLVLSSGQTVGEWAAPQMDGVLSGNVMLLLPAPQEK